MPNISISLSDIQMIVENLNYRPGSVKYKAVSAIQSFYSSEDAVKDLHIIDTDTLIKKIWDVGEDFSKVKSKRRNFSSLKSSINSDLNKLSKKDLNPQNLMINDANVFDMTDEAKNNLLNSFTNAVKTGDIDLDQATSILKTVTDFLENIQIDQTDSDSLDIIEEIKKVLTRISKDVGQEEEGKKTPEGKGFGPLPDGFSHPDEIEDDIEEIEDDQDLEEIEELEDEDELEEVEELDQDLDDIEEIVDDEELDTLELDEDEEIQELEDDEEIEEVDDLEDEDDIEEIEDDQELEEIEELSEEELKALEDFRKLKELAEQFDDTLGEREKKFNVYVRIPKGMYTIGTKKSLKASLDLQQFEMPEVYIGRYPVTNCLFEIFIDQTGYVTTAEKKGFGTVYYSRQKKDQDMVSWQKSAGSEEVPGACWHQPTGPGSNLHGKRNHPVVQVSVEDAFAYASWIGRRLPTEAEWEACARTDMGYKYPWGSNFSLPALNIEESGFSDTTQVDEYDKHANGFMVADLLGNVQEWTADLEFPPFKTREKKRYAIAKGGGWNAADSVTISSRSLYKNGFSSNTVGFRCVSEIPL